MPRRALEPIMMQAAIIKVEARPELSTVSMPSPSIFGITKLKTVLAERHTKANNHIAQCFFRKLIKRTIIFIYSGSFGTREQVSFLNELQTAMERLPGQHIEAKGSRLLSLLKY